MSRRLATTVLGTVLGAALLTTAACSGDSDPPGPGPTTEAPQNPEVRAACDEYNRVINDWSRDYGAELGQVGEAEANGDDDRREAAVESVQELFQRAADDLRSQAEETTDEELSGGLSQAADGLVEIAEQIETYDDVAAAPEQMSEGQFAEGGRTVNEICAR